MSDVTELKRYADQIRSMIARRPLFTSFDDETATSLRVDRAAILARAMVGSFDPKAQLLVDRPIELAATSRLADLRFVDSAGHSRAVYRPAFVYAWSRADRLWPESLPVSELGRWEQALRGWANLLESDLIATAWPVASLPASAGDRWAEMAWNALALHVAGKIFIRDTWTHLAADTFGRITRAQQPSGAFLLATPADQPETMWYHELQILHAASSCAAMTKNPSLTAAVARSSEFHQNETQPDHATSQPWALFAFIQNPVTRPLADQLLHSLSLQQPGAIDGVSLMLLADCLYSLTLFGA